MKASVYIVLQIEYSVMDADLYVEAIVLDSNAEEPATDYKKEELLRLRNGSLLSDYVSEMK